MFGTDLREAVMRFVARAKKAPTDASDPNLLDALAKIAKQSYQGVFAAQHAPVALYTWELEAPLAHSDPESGRVALKFPKPVEIVGFLPMVIDNYAGVLPLATPDDTHVRVVIDVNQEQQFTSRQVQSTVTGIASQSVTLRSISVLAPRLFGMRIATPNPEIGMNFSWRRGPGVYRDAIISVAAFCRWLSPEEGR